MWTRIKNWFNSQKRSVKYALCISAFIVLVAFCSFLYGCSSLGESARVQYGLNNHITEMIKESCV